LDTTGGESIEKEKTTLSRSATVKGDAARMRAGRPGNDDMRTARGETKEEEGRSGEGKGSFLTKGAWNGLTGSLVPKVLP